MDKNGSEKINLVLLYCGVRTGHFGAGSHIGTLLPYLKESDDITLSVIKTDDRSAKMLYEDKEDHVPVLHIPQPENKLYLTAHQDMIQKTYAKRIAEIIYPFVCDKKHLLFFVNSIDYLNVCMELKERLDCKVIYIHHAWTWKCFKNVPDDVFAEKWRKGSSAQYEKPFEFTRHQQALANLADHIITVTDQAKRFFTEVLDILSAKITTIYNGIDFSPSTSPNKECLRRKYDIRPEEKIILFTGRIKEEKGLSYLLKAFRKVAVDIPDVRLILAGAGDFDKFIPMAAPFWNKVIYTGEIERTALFDWYAMADIGVLPSLFEQCSFTAIEMRYHRLPMIVSSVDGLDELFTHEYDALKLTVSLHENEEKQLDEKELAVFIRRLLVDHELTNYLIDNAHRVGLEKFTVNSMQQAYLKVFQDIAMQMGKSAT